MLFVNTNSWAIVFGLSNIYQDRNVKDDIYNTSYNILLEVGKNINFSAVERPRKTAVTHCDFHIYIFTEEPHPIDIFKCVSHVKVGNQAQLSWKTDQLRPKICDQMGKALGPFLLTWIHYNPSMEK